MIEDENPIFAPRDHNQPPGLLPLEQAVADLREFLTERPHKSGKTYAERKAEFILSANRALVRDRDTAGAAGDVIKLAKGVWDQIFAERMSRTKPYRDTADALGRHAEDFWAPVFDAMDALKARIDTFTDEEDARIKLQAEEQAAEMARRRAAVAPAAAPAPEPPAPIIPAKRKRIRGEYGAVVSEVERSTYTVEDVRALPDMILNAKSVHEAIIAVVKRTAKDFGVPPGIKHHTSTENQIR